MNGLRLFGDHSRAIGPCKVPAPRSCNICLCLDNPARRWHQSRTTSRTGRAHMKLFLLKFFTWWSGQTFGTQLWTWRFGELVGKDEQGNRYYRTKGRKIDPTLGFERRWVVYNGYAEASRVPPSWHGWLHHTVDVAPTEENYTPREWEKPHVPEHDRHACGLSSLRLDTRQRPPPQGDRRLPGMDAGKLNGSSLPRVRDRIAVARASDHSHQTCELRDQRGHMLAPSCAVRVARGSIGSSYGDGKPSRRCRDPVATAPICSGHRSGYAREIGPRCRGSEIAR